MAATSQSLIFPIPARLPRSVAARPDPTVTSAKPGYSFERHRRVIKRTCSSVQASSFTMRVTPISAARDESPWAIQAKRRLKLNDFFRATSAIPNKRFWTIAPIRGIVYVRKRPYIVKRNGRDSRNAEVPQAGAGILAGRDGRADLNWQAQSLVGGDKSAHALAKARTGDG